MHKDSGAEMACIAAKIKPDEVQLNTPLRLCVVEPLSAEDMIQIEKHFEGIDGRVVSVYEKMKPEVMVIDKTEVIRRRSEKD